MNRPMKGSGREEVLERCRGILEAHTGNMVVSELDTMGIYCLLALPQVCGMTGIPRASSGRSYVLFMLRREYARTTFGFGCFVRRNHHCWRLGESKNMM